MIVGNRTEDVEIPHEPGNFLKIRELSGLEMDEAAEITSTKSLKRMGYIGAEAVAAIRGSSNEIAAAEPDPKTLYDWEYLVTHAVIDWSGLNYEGIPCNDYNKKQLDRKTLEWAVEVLLQRNLSLNGNSSTSKAYSTEDTLPQN